MPKAPVAEAVDRCCGLMIRRGAAQPARTGWQAPPALPDNPSRPTTTPCCRFRLPLGPSPPPPPAPQGADPTLLDHISLCTALHYAAQYGHARAVGALLEDGLMVETPLGRQLLRDAVIVDSQGHHKWVYGLCRGQLRRLQSGGSSCRTTLPCLPCLPVEMPVWGGAFLCFLPLLHVPALCLLRSLRFLHGDALCPLQACGCAVGEWPSPAAPGSREWPRGSRRSAAAPWRLPRCPLQHSAFLAASCCCMPGYSSCAGCQHCDDCTCHLPMRNACKRTGALDCF